MTHCLPPPPPPGLVLVPLFSLLIVLHIHPMVGCQACRRGGSVTHLWACSFVPRPWSVPERGRAGGIAIIDKHVVDDVAGCIDA
jgi:hypothetical protein